MLLLFNWIFWLTMAALVFKWVVGGVIDCFKKGSKASVFSWMGFVIGLLIIIIICAAIN